MKTRFDREDPMEPGEPISAPELSPSAEELRKRQIEYEFQKIQERLDREMKHERQMILVARYVPALIAALLATIAILLHFLAHPQHR